MKTHHTTGTVCQLIMPHYYHTMSTQLVDTSQYSFSEPTHYDNITPNSIEHACELEAYAEAMANRTYSWDEIHPAYRDHLTDSYCEPSQPLTDDEEYYEDVTDEELAEMNHRSMEYQKQLVERKVEDVLKMSTRWEQWRFLKRRRSRGL